MNHEDPLISIVIPAYNEEEYVEDLLRSIKAQTYKNYEIIGVDSYSTDKTKEILEKYGAKVVETPKSNISFARNAGINEARGSIIGLIDADYILDKKVFQEVVKVFDDDEKGSIVCVEPKPRMSRKGLRKRDWLKFKMLNFSIYLYKKASFRTLVPAAYGCDFLRVSAIDKAGVFNEEIDVSEDKEFYARLRRYGAFKMLKSGAKVSYRRHAEEGLLKTWFIYFISSISIFFTGRFKFHFRAIRKKNRAK